MYSALQSNLGDPPKLSSDYYVIMMIWIFILNANNSILQT